MSRNFQAWSVVLLLACFIPLIAHAVPQPLPDAITRAHSFFLDNQTGYNEFQYVLVLELSKWGRFELAETRDKADLVLRLDNSNHVRLLADGELPSVAASADSDIPKGCTRISLLDPKTGAMLWSDTHKTEGAKVKNGHLLDGLRQAFDAYDKSHR